MFQRGSDVWLFQNLYFFILFLNNMKSNCHLFSQKWVQSPKMSDFNTTFLDGSGHLLFKTWFWKLIFLSMSIIPTLLLHQSSNFFVQLPTVSSSNSAFSSNFREFPTSFPTVPNFTVSQHQFTIKLAVSSTSNFGFQFQSSLREHFKFFYTSFRWFRWNHNNDATSKR